MQRPWRPIQIYLGDTGTYSEYFVSIDINVIIFHLSLAFLVKIKKYEDFRMNDQIMGLVNKRHYKLLVSIYTFGWMCSLLLQVNLMTGIPSPFSLHTNQNIIIIVAFTFLSFLRDSLNSLSCSSLTFTLSLTNKLFYYNTEDQCKIL